MKILKINKKKTVKKKKRKKKKKFPQKSHNYLQLENEIIVVEFPKYINIIQII